MSAKIVDGKQLGRAIEARIAEQVEELSAAAPLRLVAVAVGEVGASDVYVRNQRRACERVGIGFRLDRLPAEVTQEGLHEHLLALGADDEVNGVILQMPLPPGLDAGRAQETIRPRKDIEGVNHTNLGRLVAGQGVLCPCTARAAVRMLEAEKVPFEGAEAVVVGHSTIVGKPLALLLLDRLATVTVCHIATRDLAEHTRRADIVIVAVGKPGLVTADMIRPGAAVVDVGINVIDDGKGGRRVVGDVDADVAEVAGLLTPVPGGVGPVTVAMLLENLVLATRRQREI